MSREKLRVYEGPLCRICRHPAPPKLITPCECKGAFAFSHEKCLEEWLEITDLDHCDVCRFKYKKEISHKSIREWIRYEEKWPEYRIRLFEYSFYSYVMIIGIILFFATYGVINKVISHLFAALTICWMIALLILFIIYVTREIKSFREWRKSHLRIRVIENENHGEPEIRSPPPDPKRAAGLNPPTKSPPPPSSSLKSGSSITSPLFAKNQPSKPQIKHVNINIDRKHPGIINKTDKIQQK